MLAEVGMEGIVLPVRRVESVVVPEMEVAKVVFWLLRCFVARVSGFL